MGDVLAGEQCVALTQLGQNILICLGNVYAVEHVIGHHAALVDGHGHTDVGLAGAVVGLADEIVVRTEAGGGMNAAGACIQCNVVAVDDNGFHIGKQRMLCGHQLKLAALEGYEGLIAFNACGLAHSVSQIGSHNANLAAGDFHQDVVQVCVEGDGTVAGQGPRCGGPNDEGQLGQIAVLTQLAIVVLDGELEDGR